MSLCFIASAQVYVGGSIGGTFENQSDAKANVEARAWSLDVQPEFGYLLNDRWAIGGRVLYGVSRSKTEQLGYERVSESDMLIINPYAAYSPFRSGNFALWAEFGLKFAPKITSYGYFHYGAYAMPVLTYDLSDHLTLKSNLGFAALSVSGTSKGEFSFSGSAGEKSNLSIGVLYKF